MHPARGVKAEPPATKKTTPAIIDVRDHCQSLRNSKWSPFQMTAAMAIAAASKTPGFPFVPQSCSTVPSTSDNVAVPDRTTRAGLSGNEHGCAFAPCCVASGTADMGSTGHSVETRQSAILRVINAATNTTTMLTKAGRRSFRRTPFCEKLPLDPAPRAFPAAVGWCSREGDAGERDVRHDRMVPLAMGGGRR